jgi:hypothetical protein
MAGIVEGVGVWLLLAGCFVDGISGIVQGGKGRSFSTLTAIRS